jgi:hypothetical protein
MSSAALTGNPDWLKRVLCVVLPAEVAVKLKALSDLEPLEFTRVTPLRPMERRRRRLERLADLLESYAGPIRLFNQIEAASKRRRGAMRRDLSPFSVAYDDPMFRTEGMEGDTFGEGMSFFCLTGSEAHELVCDCHYFGPVSGASIAERARFMAAHPGLSMRLKDFIAPLVPRASREWQPGC